MRRPLVLSVLLHLAIVVVALVGLFKPRLPSLPQEMAPVVDVLTVAELTRAPAPAEPTAAPLAAAPAAAAAKAERESRQDDRVAVPKPPPEPVKREPPPKPAAPAAVEPLKEAPPPPEPPRQAPPRPKPEPVKAEPVKAEPAKPEPVKPPPPQKKDPPEPVKPAAVPTPTPTPAPAKTVARPAPPQEPAKVSEPPAAKQASVQKPATPAPERKAEPQPRPPEPPRAAEKKTAEKKPEENKPEPKADFDAVQKAIHELGRQATAEKRTQPQAPASAQIDAKPQARKADGAAPASALDQQFARVIGKAPAAAATGREVSQAVSMSEIDAVRRQIERCWSLPPGLKGGDDLKVSIRVEMNANGTPRAARVEASPQMNASASYRATAESALRAVLNPRCHPFNLPAEKFDRWQTMTLVFDPKEMLGT